MFHINNINSFWGFRRLPDRTGLISGTWTRHQPGGYKVIKSNVFLRFQIFPFQVRRCAEHHGKKRTLSGWGAWLIYLCKQAISILLSPVTKAGPAVMRPQVPRDWTVTTMTDTYRVPGEVFIRQMNFLNEQSTCAAWSSRFKRLWRNQTTTNCSLCPNSPCSVLEAVLIDSKSQVVWEKGVTSTHFQMKTRKVHAHTHQFLAQGYQNIIR